VHKTLTRYSSWSSRLRNGCKQQQEQQCAAWAWHHKWRQLRWRGSFLLSLTGTTLCLSHHQNKIANITHKLRWNACTQGHVHVPIVLPHAITRWCGCAMGISTGPKQAVAHVFMPVMSVGNPSRWKAARMEVQRCREDGVHEAPGPYWCHRCTKYSAISEPRRHQSDQMEVFLTLQEGCIHHIPSNIKV